MGEEKKEKETKKEPGWKPDTNITMTVKKGDTWTPDRTIVMKLQEGLIKKEEKKTQQ